MTPEEQNKALDAWETSARYWDKYRVLIAQMFAPLTSGLLEEARIGMRQNVLDIGGGSGEPSLTISGIVGPTGSVMYTDPVAGMLETAQAEAGRRGLTNIIDPIQPPSLSCARSTTNFNSCSGILTEPSHRPE
jgi:methylase of polypeptide subunit release factors